MWRGRLFHFHTKNQKYEGRNNQMKELTIIKLNNGAYIDSRGVAEAIEKPHNDLMKSIRKYCAYLTEGKISLSEFFVAANYFDSTGRELPCYLLSKMGCELVANKLTGLKGVLFTAAYVTKFNEMEAAERDAEIKSHAKPRLSEFNSAIRNVLSGMSYCYTLPNRVMKFLRGAYEPLGITVTARDECDDMKYFSATEIARYLGVYSDTGRPHGHAVAAIISKLGMPESHAIAVPYGLVGVTVRYDGYVVIAVRDWIESNNNPSEVQHLDFFYHLRYNRQLSLFDNDEIDLDDDYEFDLV